MLELEITKEGDKPERIDTVKIRLCKKVVLDSKIYMDSRLSTDNKVKLIVDYIMKFLTPRLESGLTREIEEKLK